MRSFHLLAFAAAIAAVGTACGGDDNGSGPSNNAPVANFEPPSCTELSCTFVDTSTDPDGEDDLASRSWTFEGGTPATSTAETQVVTFGAVGIAYTVTLTVTDDEGESDDFTREVTISGAANQAPVADFTFECTSLACTFADASVDSDGSVVAWSWTFGEPASPTNASSEQSPSHTYGTAATGTEVTVTLTVTDDEGATASTSETFTVAAPATLTCGTTPDCSLVLEARSTVTVTLQSEDCELSGNTFRITAPVEETLFTDGCNETPGTSFQLQGGAAFDAGSEIQAQVISGGTTLEIAPAIRVTGDFATGWTLEYDDGAKAGPPPEPDFNDLIIRIVATPAP
ncbi:MAG: PKD domain-containing protein [Gemmatimonadales bacterium]|nr:PKD domain-containing protein [Gemmatimonadales bacterium]